MQWLRKLCTHWMKIGCCGRLRASTSAIWFAPFFISCRLCCISHMCFLSLYNVSRFIIIMQLFTRVSICIVQKLFNNRNNRNGEKGKNDIKSHLSLWWDDADNDWYFLVWRFSTCSFEFCWVCARYCLCQQLTPKWRGQLFWKRPQ